MSGLIVALLIISFVLIIAVIRLRKRHAERELSCIKIKKEKDIIFSFLQEIGTVFTEAINLDALLNSVLSSIVRILNAKSGAIFLTDESNKYLRASVIAGTFPPWSEPEASIKEKIMSKNKYLEEYLMAQKITLGTGIIGLTASSGRVSLITDATMDGRIPKYSEETLAIKTMLLVPLKIRENVLGVLALANKEDDQSFTETDSSLLQALGDLASISIRNANFYQTVLEKQKLDCDLSTAKEIQHMLLPRSYPVMDNWDIGTLSKTAMEIGGDYYDFIDVGKDKLGVVIADVSGKSIPGALVMSMTRSIIRSKAIGIHSAGSVIMAANELICQDIEPDMFISLVYLIIDTKLNSATYVRAGHEPIIIYRAKDAACELIKPEGMVVGMTCDPTFNNSLREVTFQMRPGDIIVLYTDGITEALNDKHEEFGLTNLLDAIKIANSGTAAEIVNNISERISRFTGNIPQRDDITLVVMKLKS